jgi:deazaflavin-dependent oxidoreductase (nitroreductase family)
MTTRSELNANNLKVINEFRQTGGTVASRAGQQLLLLGTTGAKSGLPRTNPMSYLAGRAVSASDDALYVFATKGGSPTHPDWYLNLAANPEVTVEVGADRYDAIAETVTGPERDAIYAEQVKLRPHFADYERKTTRVIPVVALRRAP